METENILGLYLNEDTDMETIINVVKNNRLVSKRVIKLKELGYTVEERRMGSGCVLQVTRLQYETLIQVGYGHGKYNYAMFVVM